MDLQSQFDTSRAPYGTTSPSELPQGTLQGQVGSHIVEDKVGNILNALRAAGRAQQPGMPHDPAQVLGLAGLATPMAPKPWGWLRSPLAGIMGKSHAFPFMGGK